MTQQASLQLPQQGLLLLSWLVGLFVSVKFGFVWGEGWQGQRTKVREWEDKWKQNAWCDIHRDSLKAKEKENVKYVYFYAKWEGKRKHRETKISLDVWEREKKNIMFMTTKPLATGYLLFHHLFWLSFYIDIYF